MLGHETMAIWRRALQMNWTIISVLVGDQAAENDYLL